MSGRGEEVGWRRCLIRLNEKHPNWIHLKRGRKLKKNSELPSFQSMMQLNFFVAKRK